jgi:hypothetical protein
VNQDEGLDEPEVRGALRDAIDNAPLEGVDWEALHQRVMAAVQEHDESAPWWAVTAHWARVVVPISVAASLIGLLTLARSPTALSHEYEYTILHGAFGDSQARLEFLDTMLTAADAELLDPEEALN